LRRRFSFYSFLLGVLLASIIAGGTYLTCKKMPGMMPGGFKTQSAGNDSPKTVESAPKMQKVVMAAKRIDKNEVVTRDKLRLTEFNADSIPGKTVYSLDAAVGSKANIELDENMILTDSMLLNPKEFFSDDTRLKDYELAGGLVAGLVNEGCLIDLEYISPTGQTFVVAAKKSVKKKIDDKLLIQTTFQEREMINYAIAETKLKGGRLETVLYIDENQQPSEVTYHIPDLSRANAAAQPVQAEEKKIVQNETDKPQIIKEGRQQQ
jgi:hypothetical protein